MQDATPAAAVPVESVATYLINPDDGEDADGPIQLNMMPASESDIWKVVQYLPMRPKTTATADHRGCLVAPLCISYMLRCSAMLLQTDPHASQGETVHTDTDNYRHRPSG